MQVLLSVLLSVLVFVAGVVYAQPAAPESVPAYEIDAQATAQAPWKVGEVVAQESQRSGMYGWADIERKFIGITTKGYFVVQDFYQDYGLKLTDPFMITQRCEVESFLKYEELHLDGMFTTWYLDGMKMEERQYQDGKRQGLWADWYVNRQKRSEAYYHEDKRQGLSTNWYPNGQKKYEGHYENGKMRGLWYEWREDGTKRREAYYIGMRNGEVKFITGKYREKKA